MELQRKIRSIVKANNAPVVKQPPIHPHQSNQGLATLIVMIVVLSIILLFCCFAAPGVRDLCKRYIFRSCPIDDPDRDNARSSTPESTTPTIILLPYGRMLVVDRNVFAQLQANNSGIDFMELSANLIRTQERYQLNDSLPSLLDSDTTSKGISPIGISPPSYDDIFGNKTNDLPPSYSEVSLMLRTNNYYLNNNNNNNINRQIVVQNIEMENFSDIHIDNNKELNQTSDDIIDSVHLSYCDPSTSRPSSNIESSI